MKSTAIYLLFDGNCEEAFAHYKEVFRTKILNLLRYRDLPVCPDAPVLTEVELDRVENISLRLDDHFILMGADISPYRISPLAQGNNFSIYLEAGSREEAERIFAGLSQGGTVTMPLQTAHWGDVFGICIDRFGVGWMINFSKT